MNRLATALGSVRSRIGRVGAPDRRSSGRRLRVEVLEARTLLDGTLDPTFGRPDLPGRGTGAAADLAEMTGMAASPDGGVLVVGTVSRGGNDDYAVVRFAPDGAIDPGFGTAGVAEIGFDLGPIGTGNDRAEAIAVQPDGRILAVGQVTRFAGHTDFGVARLLPDGRLDAEFGLGGLVVVAFDRGPVPAEQDDTARAVAIQPDGRILVSGSVDAPGDANDFGIVRLEPDGRLDAGFGDGGRAIVAFDLGPTANLQDDDPTALAVAPDGRILVSGSVDTPGGHRDFGVARLRPDGTLDPEFGAGGKVVSGFDLGSTPARQHDDPAGVGVLPDGRVVVAGTVLLDGTRSEFGVIRLDSDGLPDPSFGIDGKTHVEVGGGHRDVAAGMDLLPDERILVAGDVRDADGDSNFGVIRLDTTGALDPRFGADGRTIIRFDLGPRPSDNDIARGIGLDPIGRVLIAGQVNDGLGGWLVGAARLTAETTPPTIARLGPVVPDPRNSSVESVSVLFSEPIDPASFTPSALSLRRNGQEVPLGPAVRIVAEPGPGDRFRVDGLSEPTGQSGFFELTASASGVRDLAGNPGVGTASDHFTINMTPPAILRVGPIPPIFREEQLGPVSVVFTKPIDPSSFGVGNLTLIRNGRGRPIGPGVSVAPVPGSPSTFQILGLDRMTELTGFYELRVDASGVRDLFGNVGAGLTEVPFLVRRRATPADYDGDGITDISTFTRVDGIGLFEIWRSTDGAFRTVPLGGPGDFPVDGDFDGDGIIDPAVFGFDPAFGSSRYLYQQSSDGRRVSIPFGGPFDFPLAGDFDGDGRTDLAVFGFSPDEGFSRFGIVLSSTGRAFSQPFGGPYDFPVAGDFDGDGKTDIAVYGYSPDNGFSRFAVLPSSANDPTYSNAFGGYHVEFGGLLDSPVVGDFDGDGRTDLAVYGFSPLNGFSRFGILSSLGGPTRTIPFGGGDDLPVAGDYDGDGITDVAIFGHSPNDGFSRFAILSSEGFPAQSIPFGRPDAIGLPAFPGFFRLAGDPSSSSSAGTASAALRAAPPELDTDRPPGRKPGLLALSHWRNVRGRLPREPSDPEARPPR